MKTVLDAAWVVAFIFIFGELAATGLAVPPGESSWPVPVHTLIASITSSQAAALALMQALVILISSPCSARWPATEVSDEAGEGFRMTRFPKVGGSE